MKMNGMKLECPNEAVLVLPRLDGDLVFKARAVMDYDEFDKLLPEPKPQVRVVKGKRETIYSEADVAQHNERRMAWIIIKSLQATPDLEWETVDINKPDTWMNYATELKDSGFSAVEINRIVTLALQANALDEAKLEAARMAFLAGQGKE